MRFTGGIYVIVSDPHKSGSEGGRETHSLPLSWLLGVGLRFPMQDGLDTGRELSEPIHADAHGHLSDSALITFHGQV